MQGLQPLGVAANSVQLTLVGQDAKPATQVPLFDQGVVQILQAAVTGLTPNQPYILALSGDPKGSGTLEALAGFMTNPAGAAIVNTIGPRSRNPDRRARVLDPGDSPLLSEASPERPGVRLTSQTQPQMR
jgi:hypothetical protein